MVGRIGIVCLVAVGAARAFKDGVALCLAGGRYYRSCELVILLGKALALYSFADCTLFVSASRRGTGRSYVYDPVAVEVALWSSMVVVI